MQAIRYLLTALLLLAVLFAAPIPARAAETYHTCAGFIDALPTTIATQGVWCLRHDITTAITSGNAITIATNNVTIDCNDFKVGGLQAGTGSQAFGVSAFGHLNATVRHCNIRGFQIGIDLENGSGHLVEDNRLDQSLYVGININGDNNRVRRNAIYDTGGTPGSSASYGISASGNVTDNTVAGVFATATDTSPIGIYLLSNGSQALGNDVRGLVVAGTGQALGIYATGLGVRIDGNHTALDTATTGFGIAGVGADTFCSDNAVVNFATAYFSCEATSNNLTLP